MRSPGLELVAHSTHEGEFARVFWLASYGAGEQGGVRAMTGGGGASGWAAGQGGREMRNAPGSRFGIEGFRGALAA